MAGSSEISGVQPGIVPGKQGSDFSSIAQGVGQMMTALVNAKIQGKEMAFQEFGRLTEAAKAGIPIDPKAIEKVAKRAGLPLMKPDDMHAFVQGQAKPHPDVQIPPGGADLPGGATIPGKMMQPQTGPGAVMDAKARQGQAKDSVMTGWVQNALKMSEMQGANQQQQLALSTKLTELKTRAASGDSKAVGQLMAAGGIPLNMDFLHWSQMSDTQKSKALDVAAGYESPAEYNKRVDTIRSGLLDQGLFSDPVMANKAADAIASGHDLPTDVKSAMKPYTMQDLAKQAQMLQTGIQLGIPGDQLQGFATRAAQVGITAALPTSMQPMAQQALKLQEQTKNIEVARYQAELAHYNAMAAKLDEVAKNKASYDQFKSILELSKVKGVNLPPEVVNNAINGLARDSGMDVKEVDNFFHFLTGGTHFEYTPRSASDIASAAAGKQSTTSPQSSTFSSMVNALGKSMFGGPKSKPPQNPDEDNQL